MSGALRQVRQRWPVLLMWLLVCIGLFVYCWMDSRLDDMAGWIPAMLVSQLPVFVVAVQPAREPPEPLPWRWAVSTAISLGLVIGFFVFLTVAVLGFWIWHGDFIEMRPIEYGFLCGLIVWIAISLRFSTRLRHGPHPAQLRRGLYQLLGVGLAFVAAALFGARGGSIYGRGEPPPDQMMLLILPFLWTSPLWLLLPRRERTGAPRATVV